MALNTVTDLVSMARTLLLDTIEPYRYEDDSLLNALNLATLEARRLRPDLFLNQTIPQYSAVDSTALTTDQQYFSAMLYYVVGHTQLRDEEDVQDNRALALLERFQAQMLVGLT